MFIFSFLFYLSKNHHSESEVLSLHSITLFWRESCGAGEHSDLSSLASFHPAFLSPLQFPSCLESAELADEFSSSFLSPFLLVFF